MDYHHLLSRLLREAPFATRDDAERALETTLETLGYLLPARLVAELRASLPMQCEVALELGLTLRSSRPVLTECSHTQRLLNSLPWFTVDRIQDVCSVLGELLSPALSQAITAQLPLRLVEAFVPKPRRCRSLSADSAPGVASRACRAPGGSSGLHADVSRSACGPAGAFSLANDVETRKIRRPR